MIRLCFMLSVIFTVKDLSARGEKALYIVVVTY